MESLLGKGEDEARRRYGVFFIGDHWRRLYLIWIPSIFFWFNILYLSESFFLI